MDLEMTNLYTEPVPSDPLNSIPEIIENEKI